MVSADVSIRPLPGPPMSGTAAGLALPARLRSPADRVHYRRTRFGTWECRRVGPWVPSDRGDLEILGEVRHGELVPDTLDAESSP
jgi:hypothetical protein